MPSRPCTALATDTAKAETEDGREARTRPRFRPVGSRLGALILALNLLSLLILFVGALALNEWRRGLIEARQESLMAQAELMSNVLGELGITTGVPTPALDEYETARWLRDNFVPVGQRARVFDRDGLPVADSY
ncbi:MAG TPA: histidine kinase, partial [Brevundimonas sp.]|nr:histidine kinase [Brevundimonas sp.]